MASGADWTQESVGVGPQLPRVRTPGAGAVKIPAGLDGAPPEQGAHAGPQVGGENLLPCLQPSEAEDGTDLTKPGVDSPGVFTVGSEAVAGLV